MELIEEIMDNYYSNKNVNWFTSPCDCHL